MVNQFLICCHHCGTFFDEESRRPCLGTCSHSICHHCHVALKSATCPICKKDDAFTETVINFETINAIKSIRDRMTFENFLTFSNNMDSLDEGKCAECPVFSQKLRICVTCVKEHEILCEGFANSWKLRLVDNDWQKAHLKAKRLSICADCALDNHDGHEVVQLRSIGNLSFDTNHLLANGALLEQKLLLDNDFGEYKSVVGHFQSFLTRTLVRVSVRKNTSPIDGLTSLDWPNPKWEAVLVKSREEMKTLDERNKRLLDRLMMFEKANLKEFFGLTTILKSKNSEDWEDAKLVQKVLNVMTDVLEKMPLDPLSEEQVSEIDKQVEERMSELEGKLAAKSVLKEEGPTKYLKYKVIVSEFLESTREREQTNSRMKVDAEELMNLGIKYKVPMDAMDNEYEALRDSGEEVNYRAREMMKLITKKYIYSREIFEKQVEFNQSVIKFLEADGRRNMVLLMNTIYFPSSPSRSPEDDAYAELLHRFAEKYKFDDSMGRIF